MKTTRSSLASRLSVSIILCLTGLMVLMASVISVSPNSSLGTGSLATSARVEASAMPRSGEPIAPMLASPFTPAVGVTATKSHTPAGNRAPGDTLTYTVVITNNMASDATGVIFTDTIDPNTTLVVGSVNSSPIAFDDTYTASGNIPIAPAASVLVNDIDPDTGTNAGLTVTQVQGLAGNVGNPTNTNATGIGAVAGSVTVQSNGTFTYEPPPGFTGDDTFTYQISDAGLKTGTGTVKITISNMVWFIDNTSAGSNRGTFSNPFKTIAAFNAVNSGAAPNPQNGHHVVLRPASGSYGEADGINLRDTQTLTGPAVAFNTVFTANANSTPAYMTFAGSTGTAATIAATGGNGVDLGSGNALRGFNVGNTSGFGFNGTAVGTLTVATVSKTGSGGAMSVSTSGTFGSTVNFGTFESSSSTTNNLNLVGVTGTLGIGSAGTGFAGSAASNAAINISGGSVSFTYAGNVSKTTTGTLLNGGLLSVAGGHTGTLTFNTGTLNASNGTGLQFDNADGAYNFNGTTTLAGGDAGVDILNGSGGTFSFGTGTTITNPTGTAFNVNGSSPSVTYSGSIGQTTSGQRVVNIDTTASNTITFQTGTITGGASSTGVNLNAVTGNVTFSNGMTMGTSGGRMTNTAVTINTGSAPAIYNLGIVSIFTTGAAKGILSTNTGGEIRTSAGSVIDSAGGAAVDITAAVSTPLMMSLTSVSANGGANGIILSNTSGSFTVNGTGTTDGTGGTIQNITGRGASFSGASNITLKNMNFTNANTSDGGTCTDLSTGGCNAAIYLSSVNTVTLNNVNITGTTSQEGINGVTVSNFTLTNSTITNCGSAVEEGCIKMRGLTGTCSITGCDLAFPGQDVVEIVNSAGPTLTLNVDNTMFRDSQSSGNGGNGLQARSEGTASMVINVTNSSFLRLRTNGIQATAINSATQDIDISSNTFDPGTGTMIGLDLDADQTGNLKFNVQNNPKIYSRNGPAVNVFGDTNAVINGRINNNPDVKVLNNVGSNVGSGIRANINKDANARLEIKTNVVNVASDDAGIDLSGIGKVTANPGGATNTLDATVTGNNVTIGATSTYGIIVLSATNAGDTNAVCVNVATNTITRNPSSIASFRARVPSVNGFFRMQGFVTNAEATWNANGNMPVSAGGSEVSFGGSGTFATCTTTLPTNGALDTDSVNPGMQTSSLTQANGEADSKRKQDILNVFGGEVSNSGNVHKLTQPELILMVQAAIQRWRETGISTEDLARLEAVTLELADLPEGEIATIRGTDIKIDEMAAGYGWYIDLFPLEDSEFQVLVPNKELQTNELSPADRQIDLLTVVMRELGSVYMQGKTKLPQSMRQNLRPLMDGTLSPGVRRLPLDLLRVTPLSPIGSTLRSANDRLQAQSRGTIQPGVTQGTGLLPDAQAGNITANVLASSADVPASGRRTPARARYAEFNPATDRRTPTAAVMKFNNASDASSYAAIRATRVRSASPFSGETVTVNGSGAGFTIPAGKSVTIMFQATINLSLPPGVCSVTNPATGSGPNVTGSNFTSVTIAPDSATIVKAPTIGACPAHIDKNTDLNVCTAVATFTTPTSDACPAATVTCSPASGFAFVKGTTTVTCTAANGVLPNATCTFTVTVTDAQAPVLSGCTSQMINTAAGVCTATATYTPTATDNCDGSRPVTCMPASGSSFQKGVTTVTCSASDLAATPNTGMCTFTITVNDNQAPVLSGCTNITTVTAPGVCTAAPTYAPTATDNCDGVRPVTCVPASGSTFTKGVTTVNCSASDLNTPTANTGTCTFTVTVNDNQAPVLSGCTDITTNTGPGVCTAAPTFTPTATDNCDGSRPVTCLPASGSTFNKGVTTVTCSASDLATPTANTGMCSFTVTVNDNQAPVLTGCTNQTINAGAGMCSAMATFTVTATDNCDGPRPVTCIPASGAPFAKGVTTVSCSASDLNAPPNTGMCTFTITVNDTQPPVVTCPAAGGAFAATDCLPSQRSAYTGATLYSVGPNMVTNVVLSGFTPCTPPPVSGTANINFTGILTGDLTTGGPPTHFQAPVTGMMKVTFNNLTGATRTFDTEMLQLDLSGGNLPAGVQLRESPTLVSTGQTKITTVTGGFHIDSFFDVFTELTTNGGLNWVPDPTARHISAVQSTDAGACNAVVNYPAATATDNCPGLPAVTCSPLSGSSFAKGVTTVSCSVTDTSGNPGACSFTVTVLDTQLPTLTCPSNISVIGNACSVQTYATPTANDNCPGATVACLPASGSCFAVGTTTVTCTATDTSANTAQCTFTVTVTPCTITCPSSFAVPAEFGVCTAVATYLQPTTTGMCGTVTCTPASGSTFQKGVTTVTCNTVAGPSCTFTVTVNDTQPPMITCPLPIAHNTDPNVCTAVVTFADPVVTDNCPPCNVAPPKPGQSPQGSGCSVVCVPASGATFQKGVTTVTCTATDASNNQAQCMFTVTVNDMQAPSITCPLPVVQSTDPNVCNALVTYSNATATDNCPGVGTPVCTPASGTTFQKGVTTVSCSVSDASKNSSNCTFTVTINDTQPPAVTCPLPIIKSTDPNVCTAVVTFADPVVTDNCPPCDNQTKPGGKSPLGPAGCSVVCVPASGATFQKGVTTVTCTATDASNNTAMCSFTVTVNDTQAPSITCPAPITQNTDPNVCTAVVNFTPTATDNCPLGPTPIVCTPASGSTFQKGVTTVSCTATDTSSNTASCTFTVTINDTQAPSITCPANISQPATAGQCSKVVTYSNATATDNCPGVGTPSCVPASGATFQKGVTTVTCTVNDASNNQASCTFTVTITDTQPPVITCPANVIKGTDPNVCTAVVTYSNATATDNCPGVGTPVCTPASGTTFQKGVTTVSCTVSDASKNSANCTFTVTVNDTQNPTVTCPANITFTTPGFNDPCGTVTYTTPAGSDNCGIQSVVCAPASGFCFPVGMTTVTCTATDTSNNQGTCTFKITVQNPCTITCPANITKNNDANQCGAVATFAPTTTGGGCGTVACSPASGSFFPKGTTTVTCTTAGPSCSFTVTVNDTQPPNITCPANIIKGTDPNVCQAVVTYPNPVVSDNCPGVGVPTCSPASGTTFPKGTTTVTCTVKDAVNNMSMCSFTVTVNDTQPPVFPNGCPAGITKAAQATCPFTTSVLITYTTPVATDNCPPAPTVVCNPPSGSMLPPGTTMVTCTATDSSGNTATCSFPVNVYTFCLQDDSSDGNVVFVNMSTGDYLFCQNGVPIASGTGTFTVHGCNFQLDHTKGDRKVHIQGDTSAGGGVGSGTAFIQKLGGGIVVLITDRRMNNDSCTCAPGVPPPAPSK